MTTESLFRGYGLDVEFVREDGFKIAVETLSRMGLSSKSDNILYQSCYILHKKGTYSILHFKELFRLDGKDSVISLEDIQRRNLIAKLLEEWGIIKVKNRNYLTNVASMSSIKIVPFSDKANWQFKPKYTIGGNKK